MRTKDNIQVEDQTPKETPAVEKEPTGTQEEKKSPTFFKRTLPWLIVAVVFFLIGAGVIFFTLYQPAKAELAAAYDQITANTETISLNEVDLEKYKTDLQTAQDSLTSTQAQLDKNVQFALLYEIQANVNSAIISIKDNDPKAARQMLTIISGNLTELGSLNINGDLLSGLPEKVTTALENLESEPQTSLDALADLNQGINNIINTIKQ